MKLFTALPSPSAPAFNSHKETISFYLPSSAHAGSLVLLPASPRRCAQSVRPDRVAPAPRGGPGRGGPGLACRYSGQGVCAAAADPEQRQFPSTY